MNKIELTVAVCTFNREKHLKKCLETLVNQTLDNELYEVLIINNNSTDNTNKVAECYVETQPNFRLVQEKTYGLSTCRNKGWKKANGKYVAYIDDDAKANPDWCLKILNAFKTVSPSPVAVGGEILPFYEKKPPFWFSDNLEIRSWGNVKKFLKPPKALNGFAGSNMAFSKVILEANNGFSANRGMAGGKLRLGDEADLFHRIYQKNSLFWYDPEIIVYHYVFQRKMRISYRMRRAFKSGVCTAEMTSQNYLSLTYIKSWIHHHKKAEGGFSPRVIFWLEYLARGSGYVYEKLLTRTRPKD